jgi:hypothetical protein
MEKSWLPLSTPKQASPQAFGETNRDYTALKMHNKLLSKYLLNNSGQRSMCSCPFTDERGQRRNHIHSRHPIKEELPKGNPEFATGLFETSEGVPTASPKVAAGTAADLSFLDIIADIPLAVIGV